MKAVVSRAVEMAASMPWLVLQCRFELAPQQGLGLAQGRGLAAALADTPALVLSQSDKRAPLAAGNEADRALLQGWCGEGTAVVRTPSWQRYGHCTAQS